VNVWEGAIFWSVVIVNVYCVKICPVVDVL